MDNGKIVDKRIEAKVHLDSSSCSTDGKLSTYVHSSLWIAVNNLCIKALAFFYVDSKAVRAKVIHSLST